MAILSKGEVFEHRKDERICRQFGYPNKDHPGVAIVAESGNWCLGGDLQVLERIRYNDGLDKYRLTPAELRKIFKEKGTSRSGQWPYRMFQRRMPSSPSSCVIPSTTGTPS